ncbi:MAG: J domain-containing protein [Rickettsiales bacterium]|nr:J domain-containing protein [Rickettsiales bacterium]
MAIAKEPSKAAYSVLEGRADRQVATYWRVRINATLDQLEREARRMFQLEQELSAFAQAYYDAVGAAAERLADLEQGAIAGETASHVVAMPAALAQRDARSARMSEIKIRYRSLAKEIHPDRAMLVEGAANMASTMHTLNAAYQHGDLAVLLKLEAQMALKRIDDDAANAGLELEGALREIERAANTYADGYRAMLGSPLNELMLRAMSARLAGWDWMEAVVKKVERAIEAHERAAVEAGIAQIGAWRDEHAVA